VEQIEPTEGYHMYAQDVDLGPTNDTAVRIRIPGELQSLSDVIRMLKSFAHAFIKVFGCSLCVLVQKSLGESIKIKQNSHIVLSY